VFGDNAVRELAVKARADLDARADRVLRMEQDRFTELLADVAPTPDAAAELRAAVAGLATARGAHA
jgi:hypothetical protein